MRVSSKNTLDQRARFPADRFPWQPYSLEDLSSHLRLFLFVACRAFVPFIDAKYTHWRRSSPL